MKIINPATEELIREVAEDSKAAVAQKFNTLKSAQREWQKKPLKERSAIQQRIADLIK